MSTKYTKTCLYCGNQASESSKKFCRKCLFDPKRLLLSKINKIGSCWIYTGSKDKDGYGKLCRKRSHRISYEVHKGEIPRGMLVCHSCDNPSCANPEHLFLGTCKENIHDSMHKGRFNFGIRNGNAHLTEEDVRWIKANHRPRQLAKIARKFSVGESTIHHILQNHNWKHVN